MDVVTEAKACADMLSRIDCTHKDAMEGARIIQALLSIVERLPVTADGVCITNVQPCSLSHPASNYELPFGYDPEAGWVAWMVRVDDDGNIIREGDMETFDGPIPIEDCFSTRAAAEAAGGEA